MKKSLLLFALSLSISVYCRAQTQFCGTDGLREKLIQTDAGYKERESSQDQQIYNYLMNHPGEAARSGLLLSVPVVFHIIHQNGPENVSDSAIIASVSELNLRYQNAAPYTDSTGHPVNIEFCLASVDPWGNPTTGITRDTSFHTVIPDFHDMEDVIRMKNVNRWCPATYLNVWIVRSIGGGAIAFAAFPAPGNEAYDGIVGVYSTLPGYIMSHETGHYFNLQHTFYFPGNCSNFNCLAEGDKVCDTPPDFTDNYSACTGNSCSTEMDDTSGFNPFTADQDDLPNYMDYTLCPLSFSAGQATRMETALTLLRSSLLQSNGCGNNPGGTLPVASFTVDSSFCDGTGTRAFHSTSTSSLYTCWDFNNDGRIDAVGDSVTYTYTTTGYYDVKLIVSGYGGSDSTIQNIHVYVNPYPTYPVLNFYSGIYDDPILHTKFACYNSSVTLNGDFGMASYLWSTGETTQGITFQIDSTRDVYLTVTDNNGRVISNCTPFTINVNRPLDMTMITGSDTVNCQDMVTLRLLPNPYWFPATNTWYRNGAWYSANQFVLASYGTPPGQHDVWVTGNVDPNGCMTDSDTLTYFVNQPPPFIISQQGNVLTLPFHCLVTTWFKDGVALTVDDSVLTVTANGCYCAFCASCGNYASDTVCFTNVGMQEFFTNTIQISPNPFSSQTVITFLHEQKNTVIKVTDITGKEVKSVTIAGKQYILDMDEMSSGVYFVRVEDEQKNTANRKIVLK